MLAKLHHILRKAQAGRYAVGAFNVSDLEQTQAVIMAAVNLRSPVIVNTSEKAIEYAGLEEIAALVVTMAKKYPVPIVLNLDHGRHVALAKRCLSVGYTGIMFDGSRLPMAENIRRTAEVVRASHRRGAGVEGEIGLVKYPDERKRSTAVVMTDPDEARDFVRQTKVDAFAAAIGNNHGLPVPGERLHFDRLIAIRQKVRVPLVLHGASGTPPADLRRAIQLGICKVNIDTDLRLAFTRSLRRTERAYPKDFDPRVFLTPARQAVMEEVQKHMIIFGSRGRVT